MEEGLMCPGLALFPILAQSPQVNGFLRPPCSLQRKFFLPYLTDEETETERV